MNSVGAARFRLKFRILDGRRSPALGELLPAEYPAGEELAHFLRRVVPDIGVFPITFFSDQNVAAIMRISGERTTAAYRILAVIGENVVPDKREFLESIQDQKIRENAGAFLSVSPDNLETLTGIYILSSKEVPPGKFPSYRGILPGTCNGTQLSFKYYTTNEIGIVSVNMEDPSVQVSRRSLALYRDIASKNDPYPFHEIRKIVEMEDTLHVEQNNQKGDRQLLSFRSEELPGGRVAYRDTGNRILPMNLLEDERVPELEKGTILRYRCDLTERMEFQEAARRRGERVCDIFPVGPDDAYYLVWKENGSEGRIYRSNIERRVPDEPEVAFPSPSRPTAVVFLPILNAFLISRQGLSDLLLVELVSEYVHPRPVGHLFSRDAFAVGGEVTDMLSYSHMGGDWLVVAQTGRIGLYFISPCRDLGADVAVSSTEPKSLKDS